MVQPWDRVRARGKDPLAQLDRARREDAERAAAEEPARVLAEKVGL